MSSMEGKSANSITQINLVEVTEKPLSSKDLLNYFVVRFREREGFECIFDWAKAGGQMKRILKAFGAENTIEMIDLFFDEPSEWVEEKGLTPSIFMTQVNSLMKKIVISKRGGATSGPNSIRERIKRALSR